MRSLFRPLTLLLIVMTLAIFSMLAYATQGGSIVIGPAKFTTRSSRPTCSAQTRGMLVLAQATTATVTNHDQLQVCLATTGTAVAWRNFLMSTNNTASAQAPQSKDAPQ